jgi:hypothetical protein
MSAFRTLRWHLYQNFLMPDRIDEYRDLLRAIRGKGYCFSTIETFATEVRGGAVSDGLRCILRIDIDSDPDGAARMFDAASAEGVQATYYFRLSTLDRPLAQRIAAHGSEVGYHFEELATYAKRQGLRTAAEVDGHTPMIRDEFRRNVALFREAMGVSPRTIAAHGDFLNRRFGVKNSHVVDRALMDECCILAETHEPWLMRAVDARVSDRPAPQWWHPRSPIEALEDSPSVLYILVHPRQWTRAPMHNALLDLQRGRDEIRYRWHVVRRRP